MAPRAFSTLAFNAEARSWEKHRETLSSMSKDCLLTFAPCPISTEFSSTNLSSKNKEPENKKIHPNVFLWLWIMPIGDSFLVVVFFLFLFWSKSEYWLEEGHDNLSSRSFIFICGSLWTTRPMWARAMFHSLSLPQSLAQYLAHKRSIAICQINEKLKWWGELRKMPCRELRVFFYFHLSGTWLVLKSRQSVTIWDLADSDLPLFSALPEVGPFGSDHVLPSVITSPLHVKRPTRLVNPLEAITCSCISCTLCHVAWHSRTSRIC